MEVEIAAGRGPVFRNPVRTAAEISQLVRTDPALVEERGEAVVDAVQRTVAMLAEEGERRGEPLPLIGFAGAPFTLAAYLVEGGPSKDHLGARSLIHSDPAAWADLTAWLAEVTGRFLALQVRAGASAAQLFDSWAERSRPPTTGARCSRHPRLRWSPFAPCAARASTYLSSISASAPVRSSPTWRRSAWTPSASTTGSISTTPSPASAATSPCRAISTPHSCSPPEDVRRRAAHAALESGRAARAHVFNLGHGVPMNTDPAVLTDLVRTVHEWRATEESAR